MNRIHAFMKDIFVYIILHDFLVRGHLGKNSETECLSQFPARSGQ